MWCPYLPIEAVTGSNPGRSTAAIPTWALLEQGCPKDMRCGPARAFLFSGEGGLDRGVGRRLAEVVGEDAAGVGDDPHVQHLRRVGVMPGRRVAGAPQLDAEPGDGLLAVLAYHQVRVPAGQRSADLWAVRVPVLDVHGAEQDGRVMGHVDRVD